MPGYLTKQERVSIEGAPDLLIRSLLNRQQFADPFGDAASLGISSAAWPMFGLAWPSGAHLAARMAIHPVRAAERILEIGCGLGLASLISHRRGANITASDCHPLAESFMLENIRLNELQPIKYRHGHWNDDNADLTSGRETAVALCPVTGLFDLIIGSDLLYERDDTAMLARFIERHAAPEAQAWIVDPNRGNRPAFNRQMADRGYSMREERLQFDASDSAAAYKGRVLIYWR